MEATETNQITLREIGDEADVVRVSQVIRQQGHTVIAPTHVFERGGQIVGYASVNKMPVLTGFLHETLVTQAQGRDCIAQLERIAASAGASFICFPCTENCRFLPDMRQMGYRLGSNVKLFLKNLRF